jgi:FdhD protein
MNQPVCLTAELEPLLLNSHSTQAWRYAHGHWIPTNDQIAEEMPLALIYNGISHAVMLGTPSDLEDFALGFSLSEGLIQQTQDLRDIEIVPTALGIELRLEIGSQAFYGFKTTRRQLAGRTGCGLCGQESLEQAIRPIPKVGNQLRITAQAIECAVSQLPDWQVLHQATGGVHAAAWADTQGNIRYLREDVGRHNALDKLLGALFKHKVDRHNGFLLLTSRASHELVYKAAYAGIELIAAVSAPTSLALKHAQQADLSLVGWVRKAGFTVYEGKERFSNV